MAETAETQELHNGRWLPAIPLPYYPTIGAVCACGRWFITERGYKRHYATDHHHIDPKAYDL